jgi:hypothetical protein
MTSATIEAGERKTRTKAVTHFTKVTVVVELLRAQHGEANARKIALQEQRNARRARSRRRFEFWGRVAMLLGQGCGKDGPGNPESVDPAQMAAVHVASMTMAADS